MAEEKKEAPKEDYLTELIGLFIAILFLGLVITRIEQLITLTKYGSYASFKAHLVSFFVLHFLPIVKIVAVMITVLCTIGITYVVRKFNALRREEQEMFGQKNVVISDDGNTVENKNDKWEKVVEHINSPNASDWRLAIIEADIMLEELLRAAGYHGETLGEMLKGVEKSDFTNIDNAWEAHKVRNKIAHSGSEFPLNDREAKMVIAQYEAVFREFKII